MHFLWSSTQMGWSVFLLSPQGAMKRGCATCDCPLSLHQALFALSSMLRHFPYAQQQFLKLGGLQVLRSLFRQKGMEPLHVRVVTLLYDLIMEKVRAAMAPGLALPAFTPNPAGPERPHRVRMRRSQPSISGDGSSCPPWPTPHERLGEPRGAETFVCLQGTATISS